MYRREEIHKIQIQILFNIVIGTCGLLMGTNALSADFFIPSWVLESFVVNFIVLGSIFIGSRKCYYLETSENAIVVDTILGVRNIPVIGLKKIISTPLHLSVKPRAILVKRVGYPLNIFAIINPEKFIEQNETSAPEYKELKTTEISSLRYSLFKIIPFAFLLCLVGLLWSKLL